jgi:cytochrome c-type biogenesis protein
MMTYISKFGGVILIIMGIMVYTGWLNNMSSYLSQFNGLDSIITQSQSDKTTDDSESDDTLDVKTEATSDDSTTGDASTQADGSDTGETSIEAGDETTTVQDESAATNEAVPSIDFTLTDQFGTLHTLSDYTGKTVFLNFWATGCPPCKEEVPLIEEKYKEMEENQGDLIIITVVNPGGFLESDEAAIHDFIEEYGITFPVLFDQDGSVFSNYYINSIPTTFMLNKNNEILGYIPGGMTADMMTSVINQALEE